MAKLAELAPGIFFFHCPGCGYDHPFHVGAAHPDGHGWSFNGSLDRPTFSPSLLVHPSHRGGRCHSYVRDGRIQFLGDCEHALANQTVELPEYDLKASR